MSHKLKLLSLNVRGLRNKRKRRAIFSYSKAPKGKIFCLQETYSLVEDERVWSGEWGNNILFSHGSAQCFHSSKSLLHLGAIMQQFNGLGRKAYNSKSHNRK